jgi:hypothetical protein
MRYVPLRGELRNIRRVDYVKKVGKGKTALWQVHFTFKNRAPISQSFSDKTHGGKEAALALAKRFRNALEQEFAAADSVFGHTGKERPEEEIGISRSKTVRGTKVYWYWQATWPNLNGSQTNRKFHDLKCGGEDGSKQKAIAARRAGVEAYQAGRQNHVLLRAKSLDAQANQPDERAPYALFMPPVNLDTRVWRYMDFTKFVSLLQNGGIFFPSVASLHDPFEGSFARGNQILRPLVYKHMPNEFGISASEIIQRLHHCVAASCWHMNEHESAGMWKLYAKTNEAVCVQSTFRKLRDCFGEDVRVGTVRYVDYETDWIPESNPLAPFLYKRKSFEHEREVRAIIPLADLKQILRGKEAGKSPWVWRKVELNIMIEHVHVAPDAPDWFAALVENVTQTYGYQQSAVVKSSLASSPLY